MVLSLKDCDHVFVHIPQAQNCISHNKEIIGMIYMKWVKLTWWKWVDYTVVFNHVVFENCTHAFIHIIYVFVFYFDSYSSFF